MAENQIVVSIKSKEMLRRAVSEGAKVIFSEELLQNHYVSDVSMFQDETIIYLTERNHNVNESKAAIIDHFARTRRAHTS